MSTNYPTSVDSFTNPSAADKLNAPPHATQHADENDSIVAIQNRIGTGSQTTPGAANYVFRSTSATASEWGSVALGTDIAGTLAVANGGTGLASHGGSGTLLRSSGSTIAWGNVALATDTTGSLAIQSVSSLSTFIPWTTWSVTWSGFSSDPTLRDARYMQLGKLVVAQLFPSANGTSNATSFTLTLPVAPKIPASGFMGFGPYFCNNDAGGSGGVYYAEGRCSAGSTLTMYRVTGTWPIVVPGQAWTAVNGKGFALPATFVYEAN